MSTLNWICYPTWYTVEDIQEANNKLAKEIEEQGRNADHLKSVKPSPPHWSEYGKGNLKIQRF